MVVIILQEIVKSLLKRIVIGKKQVNITHRDDYYDDYGDGVILTGFENRPPEFLNDLDDTDISYAELEIDDGSLPDLKSHSNDDDDVPDLISHNLDAESAYYNCTIFVPQTIYNYNLPIAENFNEIETSRFIFRFHI